MDVLACVSVVPAVVPLVVSGLVLLHHVVARPLVLRLGEAVSLDALRLLHHRDQGRVYLALLGDGGHGPGALGLGDHELVAVVGLGVDEGRVRLVQYLVEALRHDGGANLLDVIKHQVEECSVHFLRWGVVLVEEVEDGIIGLLVGGDGDNRRVVVGHRLRLPLRRIDRRGDVGEHPLDGPLHGVHVHVAHDDEGL